MPTISIRPELLGAVRWTRHATCGVPGCLSPDCGCALCGGPVGVSYDDPRWRDHDEDCSDPRCALCQDLRPLTLVRGKGRESEIALLHRACFMLLCRISSQADPWAPAR